MLSAVNHRFLVKLLIIFYLRDSFCICDVSLEEKVINTVIMFYGCFLNCSDMIVMEVLKTLVGLWNPPGSFSLDITDRQAQSGCVPEAPGVSSQHWRLIRDWIPVLSGSRFLAYWFCWHTLPSHMLHNSTSGTNVHEEHAFTESHWIRSFQTL